MSTDRSNDIPADAAPEKRRRTRSTRSKATALPITTAQGIDDSQGLSDEINMMRIVIRMVGDLVDAGRPVPELLCIFDSLGKLCTRLATVLKAERTLSKDQPNASLAFSQALREITNELGIT